jgi:cryptochrome
MPGSSAFFLFALAVVDHAAASKECKNRMGEAYASNRPDGSDTAKGNKASNSRQRKISEYAPDSSKSKQPKKSS